MNQNNSTDDQVTISTRHTEAKWPSLAVQIGSNAVAEPKVLSLLPDLCELRNFHLLLGEYPSERRHGVFLRQGHDIQLSILFDSSEKAKQAHDRLINNSEGEIIGFDEFCFARTSPDATKLGSGFELYRGTSTAVTVSGTPTTTPGLLLVDYHGLELPTWIPFSEIRSIRAHPTGMGDFVLFSGPSLRDGISVIECGDGTAVSVARDLNERRSCYFYPIKVFRFRGDDPVAEADEYFDRRDFFGDDWPQLRQAVQDYCLQLGPPLSEIGWRWKQDEARSDGVPLTLELPDPIQTAFSSMEEVSDVPLELPDGETYFLKAVLHNSGVAQEIEIQPIGLATTSRVFWNPEQPLPVVIYAEHGELTVLCVNEEAQEKLVEDIEEGVQRTLSVGSEILMIRWEQFPTRWGSDAFRIVSEEFEDKSGRVERSGSLWLFEPEDSVTIFIQGRETEYLLLTTPLAHIESVTAHDQDVVITTTDAPHKRITLSTWASECAAELAVAMERREVGTIVVDPYFIRSH